MSEVDFSVNMTFLPDLEVRCFVARFQSEAHSNLQVSCFTDHSVILRAILDNAG